MHDAPLIRIMAVNMNIFFVTIINANIILIFREFCIGNFLHSLEYLLMVKLVYGVMGWNLKEATYHTL
jgi:hypothetical protein